MPSTNSDIQNIAQKIKDRATRTPLKTGVNSCGPEGVRSSCCTCGTRRVTLATNWMISHKWVKDGITLI